MFETSSLIAFRFGYGLPLGPGAALTADAMIAALAGPDEAAARFPIVNTAWQFERLKAQFRAKRAERRENGDPAIALAIAAEMDQAAKAAQRATFARAIDTSDGFRERLAAFWADHFTVSMVGRETGLSAYTFVEDALRPHLSGHFEDMLMAVARHPTMLAFLDQARSVGPDSAEGTRKGTGLNENFARELLELHTLGVGAAYGQSDVRALAELLTGMTFSHERGFFFNEKMAEPGAETVLGKTYQGRGETAINEVLGDLARHPETKSHVCRKLAVHFVADLPDEGLVDAMVQAWTDHDGALGAVYAAMLRHPAAWDAQGHKARQPYEFLIASLKALGVTGEAVISWDDAFFKQVLLFALHRMGQRWKTPAGPDGWAEEIEVWITPQGMAERVDWAMRFPSKLVKTLPNPKAFAEQALGDRASGPLLWAAERAENLAEGVGIVLSSPEFNRR
jgi:uncharacterized protein (DUF1800 family)